MLSKEFVETLIDYMKNNREQTLKENCKYLGISAQTYYQFCKKNDLDGRIGQKKSFINEEQATKLMKQKVKFFDEKQATKLMRQKRKISDKRPSILKHK